MKSMIRGASKIYPILCNNRYHLTKYTSGKSPLSTSSVLRLVSGRSPTVKDIEHRKKWELQNHDPSKSAPTPVPRPARQEKPDSPCPNALFVSAHLSGVLPVNPETAGRILNDFQSLDGNPGPKALEELCSKYQIQPFTLTLLAQIIRRSGLGHMDVVTALFSAASKLNDSQATFEIIRQAIRTSRLSRPEIHGPRRQLAGFAEAKDPEALILECQVCESEGKPKLALKLYKEVTEIQTRTGDNTKALDRSIAEAWKSISRLQIQAGHLTSAKVAIEKGALQYDDPLAYYYLAKFFEDSSSDDYLNHMLKAAASGVPQAANEIGMYYYKQMQTQKQEDSVDNRLLAQEWFAVGAECDIESSQVYLAILLRRAGKLADGLRWLEKVSHSKEWRSAIPWLKQVWGQTSFDLTKHDVETIRNVDKVMKKRSKSTSTS